ncbi:hypothetical protein BCR34DRAFT_574879 [Clohesyomyces aquaticus]|uniref:DUF7514 domain-containing protein n=1 Tax=Clohesyomyces aquaticus TaxID=1231657 RepID=A0A1Y1YTY6_9PLEO|nr:hypothetical protein BCR34DRAFT_574879 [Clohesyomyces aquaticus]
MPQNTITCSCCRTEIPPTRALVRCVTCPEYNSCADCHVTQSFSGEHIADHSYEVHMHGHKLVLPEKDSFPSAKQEERCLETSTQTIAACNSQSLFGSEGYLGASLTPARVVSPVFERPYWGAFLTPEKDVSPIFKRLIAALFIHFDSNSTMQLNPRDYCKFMLAFGFTAPEFPAIAVATNESALPTELHECDAWLAKVYNSFPLDYRMATREFPMDPADTGRYYTTMHPPTPVVPNGMPILSRLGFEEFFLFTALRKPDDLFQRLNHLLWELPRLSDPETGSEFLEQQVPRECFPAGPDPMVEEERARAMAEEQAREQEEALQLHMLRMQQQQIEQMQMQQQQYEHEQRMAILQANHAGMMQALSNGKNYI